MLSITAGTSGCFIDHDWDSRRHRHTYDAGTDAGFDAGHIDAGHIDGGGFDSGCGGPHDAGGDGPDIGPIGVPDLARGDIDGGDIDGGGLPGYDAGIDAGSDGGGSDGGGPDGGTPDGGTPDGGPPAVIAPDKELVIVHSSVMLDDRASNVTGGHWSFRWLMEQMTPAGVDPGDFVEAWLNGLHVASVNNFPMDDRSGVNALISAWPRTAAGKLDLTKAPFRLLAITNRLDINFNGSPGEGRFVFGLVGQGGFGQLMTVIFEFRLAPLGTADDRRAWAARWHALGTLGFGEPYNAALQSVTDGFASRGADPTRVAGSSLSQLRINEIQLAGSKFVWELREFNLVEDSAGILLRPVTTKQSPDASLNGSSQLADFILANADAVRAGTAVFPPETLGGNSPENFDPTVWRFPNAPQIDEPLRKAFAGQTCNGCHNAEQPVLSSFYHVDPTSGPIQPGSDGQSRLSAFVRLVDMPNRVDNMTALLGPPTPAALRRFVPRARVH